MLKVVHDVEASNEPAGGSLLDEIVRDGARQMLAAALQVEVAAYVEQFKDELDQHGRRLVVRNSFHAEREVTTAAGAIPVRAPRVNEGLARRGDRVQQAVPGRHRLRVPVVDGIHLEVRLEQDKVCLLVMIGVRADGTKELVALTDGPRVFGVVGRPAPGLQAPRHGCASARHRRRSARVLGRAA